MLHKLRKLLCCTSFGNYHVAHSSEIIMLHTLRKVYVSKFTYVLYMSGLCHDIRKEKSCGNAMAISPRFVNKRCRVTSSVFVNNGV